MAFTANSTKLPSLTLIFFSFSMNWGRTKFSFAVTHKMRVYTMFHTTKSRSNTVFLEQKNSLPSTVRVIETVVFPALF